MLAVELRWNDADRIDRCGAGAHQLRRIINQVVKLLAIKSRPLGAKLQIGLNAQNDLPIASIDLLYCSGGEKSLCEKKR